MATVHGGLDAAELQRLGLRPEQVLDFSSNVNPLGPSLRVKNAAAKANLSAYPDRHCLALREAIAARLEVGINKILVGNGTVQLIHLLTRAFLNPGQTCLIFAPTFGEYEEATTIAGGDVHFFQAEEAQQFRWSIDAAVYTIKRIRPSMVFLCNPNNPTGVYLDRGEVQRNLEAAMDVRQAAGSRRFLRSPLRLFMGLSFPSQQRQHCDFALHDERPRPCRCAFGLHAGRAEYRVCNCKASAGLERQFRGSGCRGSGFDGRGARHRCEGGHLEIQDVSLRCAGSVGRTGHSLRCQLRSSESRRCGKGEGRPLMETYCGAGLHFIRAA